LEDTIITRWLLRYATRFYGKIWPAKNWLKKISNKKFQKKFREFFWNFFLAIMVPRPIWSMPAKKIWVLGPLVWEEIENEQTNKCHLASASEVKEGHTYHFK
jgi:hypothetical protein